jgi:hypothetical protein
MSVNPMRSTTTMPHTFFFCRHRRQWHRELEIDRSSMYVDDISKLLLHAAVCYKASVWTWRCTGKCKSITRTMNLSVHLHARNEHILHRVGRCLYVLYCQRACLLDHIGLIERDKAGRRHRRAREEGTACGGGSTSIRSDHMPP